MTPAQWQGIYRSAWDLYYSIDHVETLMRRMVASGNKAERILWHTLQFHGCLTIEKVHPLQGGYLRRKRRLQRRSDKPLESPLVFYPRRLWEIVSTQLAFGLYALRLARLVRKVNRDPARHAYTDLALTPVEAAEDEHLEMFEHTEAAQAAVAKAKGEAEARARHAAVAAE